MSSNKFDAFLSKVTSRVNSKEAHSLIKKELTHHLHELSKSYQRDDTKKEEADERAVKEMGNPFTIGEHLNKIHRPKMDWLLVAVFLAIVGISFITLTGSGFYSSDLLFYVKRQAIFYCIAFLVLLTFLFFDYRRLQSLWMFLYCSGIFLLLYTLLHGITVTGAKRWIEVGDYRFGIDFTLLLFFLAWAGLFSTKKEWSSWKEKLQLMVLFWAPIIIYAALPYFQLALIYFFSVAIMLAFSNKKVAIYFMIVNVPVCVILILSMLITSSGSYRVSRLLGFINPEADPYNSGYIYITTRKLLKESGWFGNGLFSNVFDKLPEAHTDFAFPNLVYSLGWISGIILCCILLLFIWRISTNAFKTKDQYGRLLVIGGAAFLAVPIFWNILMSLGFLPIIGISLPFISYGGTQLLMHCAILGIILNVYRRKDIVEPTLD